tara:strand:+ start:1446 stop:2759 length:1314 start_codon:yes stop_codon:yes gene_type:complete
MRQNTHKEISVGICGLGTVGGGTLSLLTGESSEEIRNRVGASIVVSHVATRTLKPQVTEGIACVGTDPFSVVGDPSVDIVIETMGGYDPAFELIKKALFNKKHVVTANKALIAERGNELFRFAQDNGVILAFESSVAGGIPIIKALREGLAANRINWLAGIINGTGNFILTKMASDQRQFEDVLKEAQAKGYAETDPTFDIEGVDAAHKLTIMSSIAFGIPLQFTETYTEGISKITPEDISYADELGYAIKHLGIASSSDSGIEMRVHPTLISKTQLLANVDGVENAIMINGNSVGSTLYSGPGAGAEATASAVVADIIDIARYKISGSKVPIYPSLGYHVLRSDIPVRGIDEIETEYYLRIPVMDRVGVMAKISSILQAHEINIEAVIQKEPVSEVVPIIILTHLAKEKNMKLAMRAIEHLEEVVGCISRIRVESF